MVVVVVVSTSRTPVGSVLTIAVTKRKPSVPVPLDPTPRVTRQLLSQQLWTGRRELFFFFFFVRRKRAIVRVNESCGGDVSRSSRNRGGGLPAYIYMYRIRSRVDSVNV